MSACDLKPRERKQTAEILSSIQGYDPKVMQYFKIFVHIDVIFNYFIFL